MNSLLMKSNLFGIIVTMENIVIPWGYFDGASYERQDENII